MSTTTKFNETVETESTHCNNNHNRSLQQQQQQQQRHQKQLQLQQQQQHPSLHEMEVIRAAGIGGDPSSSLPATPYNSRILSIGGTRTQQTLSASLEDAISSSSAAGHVGGGDDEERERERFRNRIDVVEQNGTTTTTTATTNQKPPMVMSVGSGELIESPVMKTMKNSTTSTNGNEIQFHKKKTGIGISSAGGMEQDIVVSNGGHAVAAAAAAAVQDVPSINGHAVNGNSNVNGNNIMRSVPEHIPMTLSNASSGPLTGSGSEVESSLIQKEGPSLEQEKALREAVVNMTLANGGKNSVPPSQPKVIPSSTSKQSSLLPPRPPVTTVTANTSTIQRVESTERYPTDEDMLQSHAATTTSTIDSYPTAAAPSSTLAATGSGGSGDVPIGSSSPGATSIQSSPLLTSEVVNETYTIQKISPLTTPPRSPQTMEPVALLIPPAVAIGVGGPSTVLDASRLVESEMNLMNSSMGDGPTPTMSNVNSSHLIHPLSSMGHSSDQEGSFDLPIFNMQPPGTPYSTTPSTQHRKHVPVVSSSTPNNTTIFSQATNQSSSAPPLHQQHLHQQLIPQQIPSHQLQQQQQLSHKTSPMSQSSFSNPPPPPPQPLHLSPQLQPSHPVTNGHHLSLNPSPSPTNLDSLLQSPDAEKPKDNIVEKSPGERYVRFSEKLGSGAYKVVYRAYDTIEGIEVAWNVVNLSGVPKAERQYVVNEVRLLEKLNHANIISFHGSWVNREREQVIFVTEILSSGTLKSFITKVQVIRNKIAKRWAVQILKGLEYLHSHDPLIIHRDLKCDNIFINGTSGDLRIGDLGLSTVLMSNNKSKVLSVLGTPEFMAPELYDESYDQKVDIYAFGMCMLEIFTKEVPYGECSNPAQIYKKVTKGIEPESLSRIRNDKARDFIRQCLGEPSEDGLKDFIRPSASELLRHPFLASGADDDLEIEVDPPVRESAISEIGTNVSDVTLTVHPSGTSNTGLGNPSAASKAFETQVMNAGVPLPNSVQVPPSYRATSNGSFKVTTRQKRNSIGSISDGSQSQLVERQEGMPTSSSEPVLLNDQCTDDAHSEGCLPTNDLDEGGDTNTLTFNGEVITNTKENLVENEILLLKIPLKLNEKEQHVQFDFHLIEDDPVQVAKEMVRELAFPEDAVLGISERISALARKARMENKGYKQSLPLQQNQRPENATNQLQQSNVTVLRPGLPVNHASNVVEIIPQAPNVNVHSCQNGSSLNTTDSIASSKTIASQKHSNVKDPSKNTTAVPPILVDTDGANHFQTASMSTHYELDVNEAHLKQARVEHENKVKRTKKAFQTRIDNIQRSKEEKEAQYLKMIEKYEKEKAATKKRMLQTEKEQQDRLQKLDEEWELEKAKIVETSISNAENDKPPLVPSGTDEKLKPTIRTTVEHNEHASSISLLSMTSANGGEKVGGISEPVSSSSPTISLGSSSSTKSR